MNDIDSSDVLVLDVETCPDEVAAWVAQTELGAGLLTSVGPLDPARLSHGGRIDALVGIERMIGHFEAQKQRMLAAIETDPTPRPQFKAAYVQKQFAREDVACALRRSFGTAARQLQIARELVHRLPDTLAALESGAVSFDHCRRLVDCAGHLDDTALANVEARVLARASQQTPAEFRQSVRRAVASVDPDGEAQRHTRAAQERDVRAVPLDDGLVGVWAPLPSIDAAAVMARVQVAADELASLGDGRSASQCRADALVGLMLDGSSGALTTGQNRRVQVQVTVALSTLIGCDQQPGELDGYGPLPAELVRAIAFDPTNTWRRLVTDERGVLIDYATKTYRPPQPLADFVVAKHRTCRMPGCNRAARRCEIDHCIPRDDGGPTNEANLWPLCSRHHHVKHDAGWTVERRPDGSAVWTTPTGHHYEEPPRPYPIDCTVHPSDDGRRAALTRSTA